MVASGWLAIGSLTWLFVCLVWCQSPGYDNDSYEYVLDCHPFNSTMSDETSMNECQLTINNNSSSDLVKYLSGDPEKVIRPPPESKEPDIRPPPESKEPDIRPPPEPIGPDISAPPDPKKPDIRPLPESIELDIRPPPNSIEPDNRPPPEPIGPDISAPPDPKEPDIRPPPEPIGPDISAPPDPKEPDIRPPPESIELDIRPPPNSIEPDIRPPPEPIEPDIRPPPELIELSRDVSSKKKIPTLFISPITLDQSWSKLFRLSILVITAIIGTMINCFFVACFFVDHSLRKVGNVFLACTGIIDVVITLVVIPISIYVYLCDEQESPKMCTIQHFVIESCTYAFCVLYAFVGIESYHRVCSPPAVYRHFLQMRVSKIVFVVTFMSILTAAVGVFLDLDYDYCHVQKRGNLYFRMITGTVFYVVPLVVCLSTLIVAGIRLDRCTTKQTQDRKSAQFLYDRITHCANLLVFICILGLWAPYTAVTLNQEAMPLIQYYFAWCAILRSIFTSLLYCGVHSNYQRGFARIFKYFFCKKALSQPNTHRHHRYVERTTGTVRSPFWIQTSLPQRRDLPATSQQRQYF